jgi:hypothetical protein
MGSCPLCLLPDIRSHWLTTPDGAVRTASLIECETCGRYAITYMLSINLKSFSAEDRHLLSALTRDAYERDEMLEELTTASAVRLLDEADRPSPIEQMDKIVRYVAKQEGRQRKPVELRLDRDYPLAWANGRDDFEFVMNGARDRGYLKVASGSTEGHLSCSVGMKGYERLEGVEHAQRQVVPAVPAPSATAARVLGEARRQLAGAATEEQLRIVGNVCRDVLIELAQAVYRPERHAPKDKALSTTDAEGMLAAYITVELAGGTNEETRKLTKAAESLANATTHRRNPTKRDAALCVEAVGFLARVLALIEQARSDEG